MKKVVRLKPDQPDQWPGTTSYRVTRPGSDLLKRGEGGGIFLCDSS